MSLDIQKFEIQAALIGGRYAGEYLESIGKTDLSKLTNDEWERFCSVMCVNYHQAHSLSIQA
jgi:hypothetical protein